MASVVLEVTTFIRKDTISLTVPVPLQPANFKANSVLSCVFPSSSQQLQDLKIWAMPTLVEIQTAVKSFIQGDPVESQASSLSSTLTFCF